jgi:hypothetical protein
VWFILCIGYILVFTLRQAGFHWWVIFSLSGHSVLIVFLLISLYLFAIFRGVDRGHQIEKEHPLTSTTYYTVFYITIPFLGGVAGWLGMIGISTSIKQLLIEVSLGTLGATFLGWVILDPAAGFLEMVLPASSRKHRVHRLAEAKAEREKKRKDYERFLAEALANEESDRHRWLEALKPEAEKLAGLLTTNSANFSQAELEAVDIGAKAWQMGGVICMRELRDMAIGICREKNRNQTIVDYISSWWDGIGNWRTHSIFENIELT